MSKPAGKTKVLLGTDGDFINEVDEIAGPNEVRIRCAKHSHSAKQNIDLPQARI